MLKLVLLLAAANAAEKYVPGTPGAPWSLEEIIAVKGHLTRIMKDEKTALKYVPAGPVRALEGAMMTGADILDRFDNVIDEGSHLHDAVLPDIAKMVRLSFHDCIKDSETGGCNGCLNFHGMGNEGHGVKHQGCHRKGSCSKDSIPKETDNNNLLWVARVLEELYTKAEPPFSPSKRHKLKESLQESGKSRSDLWAFAGLAAVELAGIYHNNACSK